MVTVFKLSDHGAIKRRPRVLLRFMSETSDSNSLELNSYSYSAEPGDTIATTKEEEWVTRKKSEVTTTRQIATRVKRELLLEDGRILSDSGPKISTSVNEDTHTTNFQQTEHRVPDEEKGAEALKNEVDGPVGALPGGESGMGGGEIAPAGAKVLTTSCVVANPDGKVRESFDRKVLTKNVTERVRETEERFHRGDTTHEALITAVNETPEEDIRDALKFQTEQQLALVPRGPTVVRDTVAYNTTINTDDTEELRALRPDGTIVTETRHTKEQERLCDEELSKDEAKSLASDKSIIEETGGTERRKRVDLERSTDLMAGGLRVATHLHSRTRTEEGEREGRPNMDDDWDSLSVRMRRQRRLRHNEHDKEYTKRPLDFDIEEETRKKETSKWLESHFGSESRSSHDSIAEEIGRRPEPAFYAKNKAAEDEGYYGKTSSGPPPPVYGDRVLRKTKSSTPSDERTVPPVNRTGGYFKGVADWSQRRASKPRMPEPRSSSPSPPTVRSPYASNDRLNGSSPRHVYGKRDSPQGRLSPIGRRNPPSRDDSAYVSSSTMHSPPRGSPFRPLETDRSFREPSVDDDYRPVAPERKRHSKHRLSEEQRYDSGYRSSSRNENSGRSGDSRDEGTAEPPPDYSPPRDRRSSSDRDRTPPRRRDRDERKQNQKTRFADSGRRPSPVRKSVGSAIGNSIRKLVGKIRSASAERKARWRNSRTPSPEHSSRTYKQYGGELAPPVAPPHRYYLGEDPFAPSIYGREHKYEGSSRRAAAVDARDHRDRGQSSSTLGRFSHSTSRLNPNSEPEEDYTRSAQTLPRKLHERKEKPTEKPSSNKYWHRLTPNKRSNSAVNISNNISTSPDGKINGYPPGPAKPARTYKALNRSKSFAMGAPEQETHPRYISGINRNYSTMYKSNPHLSRLDETPEQLKSPGIVSIINRSQRDLADAVSRETERRKDGLFGARYGKTTPLSNGHTNGFSKSHENTDKKKIFLKGLRERAPELYQTLHADDESDGSRLSSRYGTPSPHYKERISEERKTSLYKTDSLNRETSPFVSRLETRLKSPALRRGSNSSDNFSETYRYQTRSGDPERPSITDTVETVSKKIVPSRDGRSKEIIESREINSVTKSRGYKEPTTNIKYIENGIRSPLGYELKNGYTERRSSNYKVSEKIRDY
ncbi:serine/arginine repetitive matrix protein 1 [Achroia grisella]|uniref:serine/arginine repetitive matrix protein 1 n=1 Tax=Achroia grisella TaxID=688607 RepID=UPI0027D21243|nr:serine/arginine repetitive matrix protein 1 [Achroia grisella]